MRAAGGESRLTPNLRQPLPRSSLGRRGAGNWHGGARRDDSPARRPALPHGNLARLRAATWGRALRRHAHRVPRPPLIISAGRPAPPWFNLARLRAATWGRALRRHARRQSVYPVVKLPLRPVRPTRNAEPGTKNSKWGGPFVAAPFAVRFSVSCIRSGWPINLSESIIPYRPLSLTNFRAVTQINPAAGG